MAQTILVTGGAGFIGSHVVEELLDEGFKVIVLDNFSTGQRDNLPQGVTVLERDVTDPALPKDIAGLDISTIIHMAAQASVAVSTKQPLADAEINIKGSLNMLVAAQEARVNNFIYTSSAAVYGNPQFLPISETHPVAPMSNYGVSKYVPEQYLAVYAEQFGIKTCAFRLANVYGPRQNTEGEAGVVAIFLNQLLHGHVPQVHGDGEQSRDFIYVKDVARAFRQAVNQGATGLYNIGTSQLTSVNQLLEVMGEAFGGKHQVEHTASRPGDIRSSMLDNSLAKQSLDWAPAWALAEGIAATKAFYAQK